MKNIRIASTVFALIMWHVIVSQTLAADVSPNGVPVINEIYSINAFHGVQSVPTGQTDEFFVSYTTEILPVTCLWQVSSDGGITWSDVTASGIRTPWSISVRNNSSTLSITASIDMNNNQYRCIVSNSAGSVTSDSVTFAVSLAPPTFTGHPASQSVNVGGKVIISAVVAGEKLSYQWLKDGVNIPGATGGPTYTITNINQSDGGVYRVRVSNTAGFLISDAATVTVSAGGGGNDGHVTVIAVAAGSNHSLYVTSDGDLYAVGGNERGQLGDGTTAAKTVPQKIASNVVGVAAGLAYSFYITNSGKLYATGGNDFGQLGDGSTVDKATPVQIASDVVAVAAGYYHSLYVTRDGKLYVMGWNNYGQLGDGTGGSNARYHSTPLQVVSNVVSVAAGANHSLYVTSERKLYAMGWNNYGQLGDGTGGSSAKYQTTPVQVADDVVGVSAGFGHSLYITAEGKLYAMGRNRYGQLGDGSTTDRNSPVQVAINVVSVTGGFAHSLYVADDGKLYGSGYNGNGQLGDGSAMDKIAYVQVASSVLKTIAGDGHSLYITYDGKLYSMGDNNSGQLGDGTGGYYGSYKTTPVLANGMNGSPTITAQPANQTSLAGANVSFTASAIGTSMITYQWQVSTTGTTWTNVPGATGATMMLAGVTTGMSGNQYRCIITNPTGLANSMAALLTIVQQPYNPIALASSQPVVAGNSVTFTASASGTPSPSYRWQVSTNSGTSWTNLNDGGVYSGVTTSQLRITEATIGMNGYQYRYIADNGFGTATSNASTLVVTSAPAGSRPRAYIQTIAGGGQGSNSDGHALAAIFNHPCGIGIDGTGNIHVIDHTGIRKISPNLDVTTVLPIIEDYRVYMGREALAVDGNNNVFISFAASGEVYKTSGTNAVVFTGSASFDYPTGLAFDNSNNLFVSDALNNGLFIKKATAQGSISTITISPILTGDDMERAGLAVAKNGNIYVAVAGDQVIWEVTPTGSATILAGKYGDEGHANGVGTSARFSYPVGIALDEWGFLYVADDGNGLVRRINTITREVVTIIGKVGAETSTNGDETTATLLAPVGICVNSKGDGAIYLTDYYSDVVRMLQVGPEIMTQPTDKTASVGASVTLGVEAMGAPRPNYQWYKDGVAVSGATSGTLTINNVQSANAGNYTVKASNVMGGNVLTVTSATAKVTVNGGSGGNGNGEGSGGGGGGAPSALYIAVIAGLVAWRLKRG